MSKAISILLLIVLSVAVVFFTREISFVLHWMAAGHQYLVEKLALLIANRSLRLTAALILAPLLLALIPAFIYWIFKRKMLPDYFAVVWVIWFILVTLIAYQI